METTEALGYLKGLIDGLDLDDNKKETKVFKAIIEVLENLNDDVLDITEELDVVEEQLDDIDDDLAAVEEVVYDDECFDCEGCDGCDYDDDEEYEEYEITCPSCNAEITVDEQTVLEGSFECPNCGEILNFEFEEDEDEE
jgi:DNA repair exonuclease SbcCD ATPase subunit